MIQTTHSTLVNLIAWLADNKYMLGRRFSEWTNRAPALEAAVAAAAMAQDELGHARSLYAALRNVPDAPESYLNEEKRERLLHMPLLNRSFEHWVDFVAASALIDDALTMVFDAARESTHEPLRQRAAKILQEEWFHRQYGTGWLRKLAADAATHHAMQTAINRVWSPTVDWVAESYGPSLVADGILNASAEAVTTCWMSGAKSLLAECGLMIHER